MSERPTDGRGQPVFGDDRLLALALGLDEDPELEAAAAGDEALRRRLEAMRADVAAVSARLGTTVPPPDDAYADPLDPRWAALREYFAPPAPRPSPRPRWRRLRVLAPAAAIAVALAVGVGLVAHQATTGGSSTTGGATSAAARATTTRSPGTVASPAGAAGQTGVTGQPQELQGESIRILARQAQRYAAVVVARAAEVVGDTQRFSVVRVLKGEAPRQLTLAVVSAPAQLGALNVVFLDPLPPPSPASTPTPGGTESAAEASPNASPPASPAPEEATASPAGGAFGAGSSPEPEASPRLALRPAVTFRYAGARALVLQLPSGLDPGSLSLP